MNIYGIWGQLQPIEWILPIIAGLAFLGVVAFGVLAIMYRKTTTFAQLAVACAAIMGTSVTCTILILNQAGDRPNLEIKEPLYRVGSDQMSYWILEVTNNGEATARECTATLWITKTTNKGEKYEPNYQICWWRYGTEKPITSENIRPRDKIPLVLVVSNIEVMAGKTRAWTFTPYVWSMYEEFKKKECQCPLSNYWNDSTDGNLIPGKYAINISIDTANGKSFSKEFELIINENIGDVGLEVIK